MRLYLVQHGEALSEEVDPERHLSEKGTADVERVARFLRPLKLAVAEVWHSGKPRAAQTAELVADSLAAKPLVVRRDGLAPKDSVRPARDAIERFGRELMIVGHLPMLENLASLLVMGDKSDGVVKFQYGGVVCLDNAEHGEWRVAWMIVPELIVA